VPIKREPETSLVDEMHVAFLDSQLRVADIFFRQVKSEDSERSALCAM